MIIHSKYSLWLVVVFYFRVGKIPLKTDVVDSSEGHYQEWSPRLNWKQMSQIFQRCSTSSGACRLIQLSLMNSMYMRSTHHLRSEISNFTCTFTIIQFDSLSPTNRECVCGGGIGVFYTSTHVKGCILHQYDWYHLHSMHLGSTSHLKSESSNIKCTFTITQFSRLYPVCVWVIKFQFHTSLKWNLIIDSHHLITCTFIITQFLPLSCVFVRVGVFYTSVYVKGCILHQHDCE